MMSADEAADDTVAAPLTVVSELVNRAALPLFRGFTTAAPLKQCRQRVVAVFTGGVADGGGGFSDVLNWMCNCPRDANSHSQAEFLNGFDFGGWKTRAQSRAMASNINGNAAATARYSAVKACGCSDGDMETKCVTLCDAADGAMGKTPSNRKLRAHFHAL
jgi:hypothetical protein